MEYTEIGEWCRHDDTMIYQAASVLLPLSFGGLAIAVQFPKARYALAFFSAVLYGYWLLLSIRLSWFSAVRLERAREIEAMAGFDHHRKLFAPSGPLSKQLGSKVSIRSVRWGFGVVLLVGWILAFLFGL
jgi:hypothetical protein